ncbi:ahpC/TSA family domain-containing protein [Ditylenchus destructor]|nr:ahpC/TSA family domain-containing protein [Ditylenchus destructor]
MKLGDIFPEFRAETSDGPMESFHEWIGSSWTILFSHPADFTPVCTTELAQAVEMSEDFKRRGVKMIALSCDSAESHQGWQEDILHYAGQSSGVAFPFPIIADEKRELANLLQMIDPDEVDAKGIPLTARAVFIIGPDKRLKLSILYPATTGRNFNEILRVIDSLKVASEKKVATPVNWKLGQECMVLPSLSDEDAKALFGDQIRKVDLPSKKPYMRFTDING